MKIYDVLILSQGRIGANNYINDAIEKAKDTLTAFELIFGVKTQKFEVMHLVETRQLIEVFSGETFISKQIPENEDHFIDSKEKFMGDRVNEMVDYYFNYRGQIKAKSYEGEINKEVVVWRGSYDCTEKVEDWVMFVFKRGINIA